MCCLPCPPPHPPHAPHPATPALAPQLPIVGGVLNSVWNLPGNPRVPHWFRAVESASGRDEPGWLWEHFWLVVNGVSILNNIVFIIPLLGTDVLQAALDNSTGGSVGFVVMASLTWSIGTIGFGTAIKLVGVGLGTGNRAGACVCVRTHTHTHTRTHAHTHTRTHAHTHTRTRTHTTHPPTRTHAPALSDVICEGSVASAERAVHAARARSRISTHTRQPCACPLSSFSA